jgi:hypothetical protein
MSEKDRNVLMKNSTCRENSASGHSPYHYYINLAVGDEPSKIVINYSVACTPVEDGGIKRCLYLIEDGERFELQSSIP